MGAVRGAGCSTSQQPVDGPLEGLLAAFQHQRIASHELGFRQRVIAGDAAAVDGHHRDA